MGQNFEGIVYFEVSDLAKQGMREMPYMIKGNKARMEFGKGQKQVAVLLLPDESRMVFIMDAMKGYVTMNTDQSSNKDNEENIANTEAAKTGVTKTIAGRECEVWKIESDTNTIKACMTKGMGTFMMPRSPMGQNNTPQWAKELIAQGAMPLEVIELTNGTQSIQMRATRIEEKSLSEKLFNIPEGYSDMSKMMQQMQNRN